MLHLHAVRLSFADPACLTRTDSFSGKMQLPCWPTATGDSVNIVVLQGVHAMFWDLFFVLPFDMLLQLTA